MIRLCQLRLSGRGQYIVVFRDIFMKHASQIQFGRPDAAVLEQKSSHRSGDKWSLLALVTEASDHFGLSHRTLSVLKALMTFLPTRHIPVGPGAVVFPSNRKLSERLSGMPESTLRRHLNQLVRAGIVSRQDSPNKKRYARQISGSIALAFGFDLSPLIQMEVALEDEARKIREQKERLTVLRECIMLLRAKLLIAGAHPKLVDEVGRLLRRKPCQMAYANAKIALEKALGKKHSPKFTTTEMSGTDGDNNRHIQYGNKILSDSETTEAKVNKQPSQEEQMTLPFVTNTCVSFQSYFPEKLKGWSDLIRLSERLAPMLGIEQPVLHQAKKTMGAERAGIVVLCILERLDKIKSPGAYLRHLSKVASTGQFSVMHMLNAISAGELSADNINYV